MLKTDKPSFLVFPLLGVSLLLWLTPVFADDAKQSISAQNGSGGSDAGSTSTSPITPIIRTTGFQLVAKLWD